MNPLTAAVAFFAGLLMGGVYFGLLWLTLQRLPEAKHPALLAGVSLVVRTVLMAGGLWLVVQGGALQLLVALAGVLAARTLMIRRIRPGGEEASWI